MLAGALRGRGPARAAARDRHRLGGGPRRPAAEPRLRARHRWRRGGAGDAGVPAGRDRARLPAQPLPARRTPARLRRPRTRLRCPDQCTPALDRVPRTGGTHPMTVTPAGSQMLTALVRLRAALQGVALPLDLPDVRGAPDDARRDGQPARGLRHPAHRHPRGSAARGRRRLDRCRQVDAGELAGRRGGDRVGRAASDHPVAGARAQSGRRRWFGADRLLPGARAGPPPDPRPPRAPARRRSTSCRKGSPSSTPRTSTRSRRATAAGRAAPRRRRPVAVRHLSRAVRRPGAVGLPASGRRALGGGRDRARPHAAGRRRDRRHPPGPDAGGARAQGLAAVRRQRGRRSTRTACLRPATSPRSAAGSPTWAATPRPAPRWSGRRSRARSVADPARPHGRGRVRRADRGRRAAARERRRGVRRGDRQAARRHRRRHAAARRGARAVAGVRRHRGAGQDPGGEGRLAPRPDGQRDQGQAPTGRARHRRRRVEPRDADRRARRGGRRACRGVVAEPGAGAGAALRRRRGPRPGLAWAAAPGRARRA